MEIRFFLSFPPLNVTLVCFALLFGVFHEFAYIFKFSLSFFSSGLAGLIERGGFCWLRLLSWGRLRSLTRRLRPNRGDLHWNFLGRFLRGARGLGF